MNFDACLKKWQKNNLFVMKNVLHASGLVETNNLFS